MLDPKKFVLDPKKVEAYLLPVPNVHQVLPHPITGNTRAVDG